MITHQIKSVRCCIKNIEGYKAGKKLLGLSNSVRSAGSEVLSRKRFVKRDTALPEIRRLVHYTFYT